MEQGDGLIAQETNYGGSRNPPQIGKRLRIEQFLKRLPKNQPAAPQPAAPESATPEPGTPEPAQPESAAPKAATSEQTEPPPPIYVVPGYGNVTITSEDPEALDQFEALLRAMSQRTGFAGQNFIVFLLENANADEAAEIVRELTGSKSKLVREPLPADDPTQRQPDITLAKKHLQWEPTVALRDGLAKTIDWFRSIDFSHYRPPTPNY